MINGSFNFAVLLSSAIIGALLYILKVPSITLGLGMYLPLGLVIPVFIGGVIRYIVDKVCHKQADNGTVIASGIFGGESIVGVVIAFIYLLMA